MYQTKMIAIHTFKVLPIEETIKIILEGIGYWVKIKESTTFFERVVTNPRYPDSSNSSRDSFTNDDTTSHSSHEGLERAFEPSGLDKDCTTDPISTNQPGLHAETNLFQKDTGERLGDESRLRDACDWREVTKEPSKESIRSDSQGTQESNIDNALALSLVQPSPECKMFFSNIQDKMLKLKLGRSRGRQKMISRCSNFF